MLHERRVESWTQLGPDRPDREMLVDVGRPQSRGPSTVSGELLKEQACTQDMGGVHLHEVHDEKGL